MRTTRFTLPFAVAFALTVSATSFAQEERPDPDQLFRDATALIDEEKYAEALPKLEQAQRLDPGIGTQFNLAICYMNTGRLALAWRNFAQVEILARAAGKKERERAAKEKLEELRPRVAHLVVKVEDRNAVTVRVDGEIVSGSDLGFVPLDPGEHKVEAVAAVQQPFETTVVLSAEGEQQDVVVPVLIPIVTKTEIRTVTRETTNTKRTLGYVFGGIGLAGVVTAAVTGIMILSDKSKADERCKPACVTPNGDLDTAGVDAVNRGKTLLPINVVGWVVGGAGLGVGAYFLLASAKSPNPPAPKAGQLRFVPVTDGRGAYGVLSTRF